MGFFLKSYILDLESSTHIAELKQNYKMEIKVLQMNNTLKLTWNKSIKMNVKINYF